MGNRISHSDDWQTVEYQYNSGNQMLQAGTAQYTYDENGNRIQKSDAGEVADYYYNYDNLMAQVSSPNGESTGYGYDAMNRRIYKVDQDGDSTSYLYDGIEEIFTIIDITEMTLAEIFADKYISNTLGSGLKKANAILGVVAFPRSANAPTSENDKPCK